MSSSHLLIERLGRAERIDRIEKGRELPPNTQSKSPVSTGTRARQKSTGTRAR